MKTKQVRVTITGTYSVAGNYTADESPADEEERDFDRGRFDLRELISCLDAETVEVTFVDVTE